MVKKVNMDYRVPIVANERVPPGMGVFGLDKDGKLVVAINLDKSLDSNQQVSGVSRVSDETTPAKDVTEDVT